MASGTSLGSHPQRTRRRQARLTTSSARVGFPQFAWHIIARRQGTRLRAALRRPIDGFEAVCVLLDRGGGVLWIARERAGDVAAPRHVIELRADCEN